MLHPLATWVTQEVSDPEAQRFLQIVFDTIEVWDDLLDRDKEVASADLHRVFTQLLVDLPLCTFFRRHQDALVGHMVTAIAAWHASNAMVRGNQEAQAQAYVLRKEFINLVVLCVALTAGMDKAIAASVRGWQDSAMHDRLKSANL